MTEPTTNDSFTVRARHGDATRTVGYTGVALIAGIRFNWLAASNGDGFRLEAAPADGGKWDAEAQEWTLPDDSTIPGANVAELLQGLSRILTETTTRATTAAAS